MSVLSELVAGELHTLEAGMRRIPLAPFVTGRLIRVWRDLDNSLDLEHQKNVIEERRIAHIRETSL